MERKNVNRRGFLAGSALGIAGLGLTGENLIGAAIKDKGTGKKEFQGKRPNVVVIVADDHRWDLMSCAGHKYIKTPNFDRLASEGMLFENAFACSGVCSPSRGSILTGQYAHQAATPRITWMNNTFRAQAEPFPVRLHNNGYHSAHFGKWHLGAGNLGMPGYDHWAGFEWLGAYFNTVMTVNGEDKKYEGFSDDIISGLAADYIKERAATGQPFCAFVGLKSPHLDFQYPPRHEHVFDGVNIPKPYSYNEDLVATGKVGMKDNILGVEDFIGGIKMFGDWDNYVKSYYRSTMAIDDAVGTVLAALDEVGVADDTIVIYTSDQGYTLGEHGLTEKHYSYEEPMRVPMIVRYPKAIKAGVRRKEMALTIDIAPTIFDLCGVDMPDDLAGESWRKLFEACKGRVSSWRDDFFFETVSPGAGIPGHVTVRTDRYKLITYPWLGRHLDELYDLDKDPREMKNVINEPGYKKIVKDMNKRLERLKKETDWSKVDDLPVESMYVLGPVPNDKLDKVREQVVMEPFFDVGRNEYEVGDVKLKWQKIESSNKQGGYDFSGVVDQKPGHTMFAVIGIEKLKRKDPYLWTSISPVIKMKGYVNGRKYHDTPGGPGAVPSLMSVYNPPLLAKKNIFILEFDVRKELNISFLAPVGSVSLY